MNDKLQQSRKVSKMTDERPAREGLAGDVRRMRRMFTMAVIGLFLFASTAMAQTYPPAEGEWVTVKQFTPPMETPENVKVAKNGIIYTSLLITGQVHRQDPFAGVGDYYADFAAEMSPSMCAPGQMAGITGLAMDEPLILGPNDDPTFYVNVLSCDPAKHGIWVLHPDGSKELVATAPFGTLINGAVLAGEWVFIVESFGNTIYMASKDDRGGEVAEFVSDDLFGFDPTIPPPPEVQIMPGPNGLVFDKFSKVLGVGNSGKDAFYEIDVFGNLNDPNDPPIAGAVYFQAPAIGFDDGAYGFKYIKNAHGRVVDMHRVVVHGGDYRATLTMSDLTAGTQEPLCGTYIGENGHPYSLCGLDGPTDVELFQEWVHTGSGWELRNVLVVSSASFLLLGMPNTIGAPSIKALGTDLVPMKGVYYLQYVLYSLLNGRMP